VYDNVESGVDVHNLTATIITGKEKEDITSEERQDAKAHTFAPLYGATGMGLPEHIHRYYYQFTDVYPGIGEWHLRLAQEALKYKVISLPSGREYRFPYVKRTARGITHGTSVKNYPVQGFATADLLPSALVLTFEEFKKKKLKSLLCNTVHDSIVVDVHPDEEEIVIETLKECMLSIPQQAERRWGINYDMPVGIELKIGSNWLDTKEIFSN
jgi:DNA polymerase-1